MKKNQETVQTAARQAYEKPTMQVYEMETEGAIMDNASGVTPDYPYAPGWTGEAEIPTSNPRNNS